MAIRTADATGQLSAAPANESFFDILLSGVKAPLMASNEYLDAKSALWGTVAYVGATMIGTSILTRKRVNEGKPAIAGIVL